MEKLLQKAKKTKMIFTVLLVVGIIGICVAAYLFVPDTNTSKDAVNMKNNPAEGSNAYIEMIGLSDSWATYEAYEKLGMYLAEDKDGNLWVVAMDESDFKKYTTQYQYFFYGTDPTKAESVRISGQVEKVDRDIKKYACEYINYLYDDEVVTVSTYDEFMGVLFLNTNVSATSYTSFFWGLLVGIVSLIIAGLSIYQVFAKKEEIKNIQKVMEGGENDGTDMASGEETARYDYENEMKKSRRRGIAILVGIAGAFIGALIPVAIGIFFETIWWYAGACIPLGFALGYGLMEKGGMTVPAKLLNIIVSTALGFLSMYVIYAWVYFKSLSGGLGHISFFQALANLIPSLSAWDNSTTVIGHLIIGTGVAFVLSIIMSFSKKDKN